jgi:peptide/nickel transport system substrate-binding protein
MWRTAWRLLVAANLIAVGGAATRPHYGGTLRMQTSDRALPPYLTFDSLVRFDDSAQPRPALAAAWRHDADLKRWEFQLRPGVRFHDGTLLTAAAAAAALERLGAIAQGESVLIRSDYPKLDLLQTLSDTPIAKYSADGNRVGTGPFRIVVETRSRAVLKANEEYWDGRPYLDGLEIDMGRSLRDQALDFDLNKADIVEFGFGDTRRATQNGKRLWTSAPIALLALVFDPLTDERARAAIALSIDRSTIHNVLLQRQGAPAGSILPQWLSGYAFLFPTTRDLERARQLTTGVAPVTIAYDPADATARLIAERIAVNARDAGLIVRPTAGAQGAGRIVRANVGIPDPFQALLSVATALGVPFPGSGTTYQMERSLLGSNLIVPLFHLPEIYGLGPRVRGWAPSRWGGWKLDQVWLAP